LSATTALTLAVLWIGLGLLGPRLGRLTLATVVDLDASVEHHRAQARAPAQLERQGRLVQLRLSTGPRGAAMTCWWWAAAAPGRPRVLLGGTATTPAAHAKVPVLVAGGTSSPAGSGSCTMGGRVLDAGSYGFVPAGRSHGIEQVERAGCLLFYVYSHQGTIRQGTATARRGVAPSTTEQQVWAAAAAEIAGRRHPIADVR
jgi:hypothetical protein